MYKAIAIGFAFFTIATIREPLIKSSADCVAGKMRMDARCATKVVARTTKPRSATTQTPHFAATRRDGCRDTVSEAWGAGAAASAPRLTVSLAAACAPSRTTLRETESGAPCPGGLLCRSASQGR